MLFFIIFASPRKYCGFSFPHSGHLLEIAIQANSLVRFRCYFYNKNENKRKREERKYMISHISVRYVMSAFCAWQCIWATYLDICCASIRFYCACICTACIHVHWIRSNFVYVQCNELRSDSKCRLFKIFAIFWWKYAWASKILEHQRWMTPTAEPQV